MGTTTSKIAVIAALSSIWPTLALPQQAGAGSPGGLQFDVGVSSTLKADSNFSLAPGNNTGTSYISDTKLTFGLSSSNSAYDLRINSSGVLRFADIANGSTTGFEDPSIQFRFVTDSSNSRLTMTGRYRSADRDFLNPFQVEREEQLYGLLVGDGGTLINRNLGLKYETGLNAPIGFVLDLKHDDKSYKNVVNPLIFDNTKDSATATLSFKLNPVITGRVSAGQTHYTADDTNQTDRTTNDFSVGAAYDINPVLQLDAQIGYTEVTTDTISGTTQRDGLTGSFNLTQTLQNGTVFGSIASTRNQNGQRLTFQFGRDLQLPNGALRGAIGVTSADIGDSAVIGSLSYSKQLPSGSISFNIGRSASTNGLNQEILDTRVGVNYGYVVSSVSQIGLSLDWGKSEDTNPIGGASTIERTDLTASYTHDLTSDWSLTSGMTYRMKTETGKADANSTALFVTLGRNFSFRP